MKGDLRLLAVLIFGFGFSLQLSAQCSIDPKCTGSLEPGEYCPGTWLPVVLDVPHDATITFILPKEFEYNGTIYALDSLVIDSVRNIPPGLTYNSSANRYVPEIAYCSQLIGTPTQAGVFNIEFYIEPFIDLGQGSISLGQYLDDTSVVITVYDLTGINPRQAEEFQILPIVPNPFSETTRISFYTPFQDRVSLQVYNILGKMMYEETQNATSGEQEFEFNGSELLPGTYFYRVINSSKLYTGKFIKSK